MKLIKTIFIVMTLTYMLTDISLAREPSLYNAKKRMVTFPASQTLLAINDIDNVQKRKARRASMPARTTLQQRVFSSEEIKDAQMSLKERGLYDGPVNGIMDVDASESLKRFQLNNSLENTGKLNNKTYTKLTGNKRKNVATSYTR